MTEFESARSFCSDARIHEGMSPAQRAARSSRARRMPNTACSRRAGVIERASADAECVRRTRQRPSITLASRWLGRSVLFVARCPFDHRARCQRLGAREPWLARVQRWPERGEHQRPGGLSGVSRQVAHGSCTLPRAGGARPGARPLRRCPYRRPEQAHAPRDRAARPARCDPTLR